MRNRSRGWLMALVFAGASVVYAGAPDALGWLDAYNVVWDSPSKNSAESMPAGGHSIGLNVWVEKGDILFYAQRSGSFTENNEYHKLGRFRLRLSPNPFEDGGPFRQELKLREGYVEISGKNKATVSIWCEALRPVVHVDVDSPEKISATVSYEGWRNEQELIPNNTRSDRWGCFSWEAYPGEVSRFPDVIEQEADAIYFHHRNREDRLLIDYMVKQQGLSTVKDEICNTQKGRTFGGCLTGDGFVKGATSSGVYINTPYKAWNLRSSSPRKKHSIRIFTHVAQTETLTQWQDALAALSSEKISDQSAKEQTRKWWEAFWQRSRLVINAGNPESSAWKLGRNYQLFRYQLGCNYYGEYPTKFNGGNFTYDPALVKGNQKHSPDWRAWGGGSFTAQNQRLLYWPLLKTGDFEAMRPQLEFYRRMLPTGVARAKTYFGHGGAYFGEQTENFGLPVAMAWGWTEPGSKHRKRSSNVEPGVLANKWIVYHYESQLEFAYMMLEYQRYTGADISEYMEFIKESVRFFDEHYQMRNRQLTGSALDPNGLLSIYPSTACETYKMARNPADVVAGLDACLDALTTLGAKYLSADEREYFEGVKRRMPSYFYEEVAGDRVLKPAESWKSVQNVECPQFYPLFPFNRFSLADDEQIQVLRDTWKHGTFKKNMFISWHQDGIFFARMGMVDDAAAYNSKKMMDAKTRFPTFWGPGHDWVPDHNWGGSGMIGMQEMLLQTVGDEIRLFPAWPRDWDVTFKLYAPKQTVIEGRLVAGTFELINITPASRAADVVNMLK